VDNKTSPKFNKKIATTIGATKALIKLLRSNGISLFRPRNIEKLEQLLSSKAPGFIKSQGTGLQYMKDKLKQTIAGFYPSQKAIFINNMSAAPLSVKEYLKPSPRNIFFHEAGHALHAIDDPVQQSLLNIRKLNLLMPEDIALERIANNNAINFMRENKVPQINISNYIKNVKPAYATYLNNFKDNQNLVKKVFPEMADEFKKRSLRGETTQFSPVPRKHFSVPTGKVPPAYNKKAVELSTSVPNETPDDLYKRIISKKINIDQFFNNATKHNWDIPGIPGFLARTVARKAEKDPDPYLNSLINKVPKNTVIDAIKRNPDAFKNVSNKITGANNVA